MERILECCCDVDVHKDMIEACIIKGLENPEFIRMQFSTFPSLLKDFVEWLYENDCNNLYAAVCEMNSFSQTCAGYFYYNTSLLAFALFNISFILTNISYIEVFLMNSPLLPSIS